MTSASKPNEQWSVFLPLKQFSAGKSRLGNIPADFRISLIKAIASDLIDALLQVSSITSITVVGIDHQLLTNATNARLNSYPIAEPIDINSDLQISIGEVNRFAVFLPDLPSVKPAEITLAFELASAQQTSFIADQNGLGSTAFFGTTGKVQTHFGANSAAAHRAAGAHELINPSFKGIKADCDDWSDLLAIDSNELGHSTRALLEHHLQK